MLDGTPLGRIEMSEKVGVGHWMVRSEESWDGDFWGVAGIYPPRISLAAYSPLRGGDLPPEGWGAKSPPRSEKCGLGVSPVLSHLF